MMKTLKPARQILTRSIRNGGKNHRIAAFGSNCYSFPPKRPASSTRGLKTIHTFAVVADSEWVSPRNSFGYHSRSVSTPNNYLNNYCWKNSRILFASSATAAATDDSNDMYPFLLADIGEGIKEVELLQWFVQPGDTIHQFDKICEVQSDKATVDITSRYDGTVAKLSGDVGEMVQVGSPLLYFEGTAGASGGRSAASSASTATAEDSPSPPQDSDRMLQDTVSLEDGNEDERLHIPSVATHFTLPSDGSTAAAAAAGATTDGQPQQQTQTGKKFLSSPAVRKLGKEYNIDLSTIHATGPSGRLLKSDVISYLKQLGRWKGEPDRSAPATATPSVRLQQATQDADIESSSAGDENYEIVTLKGYNRLMMKSMTAALQIPHMCFGDEFQVDNLVTCRQRLKALHENVSFLIFFIKALSLALKEYPTVNATVHDPAEECQLKVYKNHHIGVAMDTPRGLVVPVLRNVDSKSLLQLQTDLDHLKDLAKETKLTPEHLHGPTFTLSNIGSIGGTYMQPVLVPPQIAMGAIGQIQRLPRFVVDSTNSAAAAAAGSSSEVYSASIMHVTWAADHRFLDGATLARFNAAFKAYVENPDHMLAHLK